MNHSMRLKKYFSGEVVDFQPYTLHLPENAIGEFLGYSTSEWNSSHEAFLKIYDYKEKNLGLDGANVRLSLQSMGIALGSKAEYPKHGYIEITEPFLKNYDELKNLKVPNPKKNPALSLLLERADTFKKNRPNAPLSTGVVGAMTTAISIRPQEAVLNDMKENKKALSELLDFSVCCALEWLKIFTEEFGAAEATISDPVSSPDVLTKEQFEEFSFPALKKLVEGVIEITKHKPSLHICGHTKPIWHLLSELPLSSFSVGDSEKLSEVKQALGDSFTILGNVDPLKMKNGTPDEIRTAVKNCLKDGADSPKGYIISSGCEISLGTPKENIFAYLDAVKTFGKNAAIGKLPQELE